MKKRLMNYATIFAFVFLCAGVVLQNYKIVYRESSADISLLEISFRALASTALLIKMISTKDRLLSFGQSVFLLLYIIYVITVFHYQ